MRPAREVATNNSQTYFVTSNTAQRRTLFASERWSSLFIETLIRYRPERYLLHGFVVMPDHFHVLLTPAGSLERAVQCLKGGFSFAAKREFQWSLDVWAAGFSDHRIRNVEDIETHVRYIAMNPVQAGLVRQAKEYPFSSASGGFAMDAVPQWLKPPGSRDAYGGAEAPPFQNAEGLSLQNAEGLSLQNAEGLSLQNAEASPFQNTEAS